MCASADSTVEGDEMDPELNETAEVASASGIAPADQPNEPPLPSNWRAWFMVAILVGIYMNSFLDRQIMNLLLDEIKESIKASDTQMGLLIGFAFALFYATVGLPIGYLVDRRKRTFIIIFGQFFWIKLTTHEGIQPLGSVCTSTSRRVWFLPGMA